MALNGADFAGGEDQLVSRACAGDTSAFEQLYSLHYRKVLTICRGILLDLNDAEDSVQEVFTLAYRKLHTFDRRSSFKTWVYRIAVNHSIQKSRSAKRRQSHVELQQAHDVAAPEMAVEADPRVHQALDLMKPDDRAVLVLFYWDELSVDEIGQALGCRANAVKTRLYRARDRFRTVYEELS